MAIITLPNGASLDTKRVMAFIYQPAFSRPRTSPPTEEGTPQELDPESKLYLQYKDGDIERKTTLKGDLADKVHELLKKKQ